MSQMGRLNSFNPPIETLTGNVGGAVGPTGNNINVVGSSSITVTGNPGTSTLTITYTGATPSNISYVSVNHGASPYTALATDYYISADVTGGVITIRLPNAPIVGRVFIVKDQVGLASTSIITVTTVGGVVDLDGATTYLMNTAYEVAQFVFNGTFYEIF